MEINDAANNINHLDLHVQCQTFCVIVTKYVVSRQIFIKDHNTKFHSFTCGNRTDVCCRTDGRTDGQTTFTIVQKHLKVIHVCSNRFLLPMRYRQTFKKFLFAATLFNHSSATFHTPTASCKYMHAYCTSFDVIVFCCSDIFFETVNMFIKSCSIIHPTIVLPISFEHVVWQVAWTQYEYFRVRGEGNSRKVGIHNGSIRKSKRNSLQGKGWRGERQGKGTEGVFFFFAL